MNEPLDSFVDIDMMNGPLYSFVDIDMMNEPLVSFVDWLSIHADSNGLKSTTEICLGLVTVR